MWGSRVSRPRNFNKNPVVVDSDAWTFRLDSKLLSPIKHMLSVQRGLLLFTGRRVWLLSGNNGGPVTPTENQADIQTYKGSAGPEPLTIGSSIVFLENGGKSIQLLRFNAQGRQFEGRNISILVEHLISEKNPIISWAYAEGEAGRIYMITRNGKLIVMTIDLDNNRYACTLNVTDGRYQDVVVVREGTEDVVYFTIVRNGRVMLEREEKYGWTVDSGLSTKPIEGADSNDRLFRRIDGLWHLEGREVTLIGNSGAVIEKAIVNAGSVTFSSPVRNATIGLPFKCIMQTLPPVVQGSALEGKRKLPISASFYVLNTKGLMIGQDIKNRYPVKAVYNRNFSAVPGYKTQEVSAILPGSWDATAQIYMMQEEPVPATILALAYELEVGDD